MSARVQLRRMLVGMAALAVAITALMIVGSGQALGDQVSCGETITKDTTLDNDLIDCPPADSPNEQWGDAIVIGADDVTLDLNGHTISTNAPIHSGAMGVNNEAGYDRLRISNGTIRGFPLPVYIGGGVANSVDNVTAQGRFAITLRDSPGSEITRSRVLGGGGGGISLYGAGPYLIEKNTVLGGRGGILGYSDATIYRIRKNVVSTDEIGIQIQMASGSVIEHNTLTGNPIGMYVSGPGLVAHNRVEGSAGDGIVSSGPVTIAHNRANDNGNLGIDADASVIDGGGNKASGNGNPLQCLNIACK